MVSPVSRYIPLPLVLLALLVGTAVASAEEPASVADAGEALVVPVSVVTEGAVDIEVGTGDGDTGIGDLPDDFRYNAPQTSLGQIRQRGAAICPDNQRCAATFNSVLYWFARLWETDTEIDRVEGLIADLRSIGDGAHARGWEGWLKAQQDLRGRAVDEQEFAKGSFLNCVTTCSMLSREAAERQLDDILGSLQVETIVPELLDAFSDNSGVTVEFDRFGNVIRR